MKNERFNARSDAPSVMNQPGVGDDVACVNCGEVALDTGLECDECGFDNSEVLTGKKWHATKPAAQRQPLTVDCIGLALDLETQSKRVESQTVERAMIAAANGLRIIEAAHGIEEKNT